MDLVRQAYVGENCVGDESNAYPGVARPGIVDGFGPLVKQAATAPGGEASAERKAGMISFVTKPLKNGKCQTGIEYMLLLAFVTLASSLLFIGAGSINFGH